MLKVLFCFEVTPLIYLVHHGIRGQKWGVKNGPPYPLDADQHSAREQKSGWRSSLSKPKKKKPIDISNSERFRLTEKQKKALKIGAAIAATALISYGGYKLYKTGALDKFIDSGKTECHDIFDNSSQNDVLHESRSARLKACNPFFTVSSVATPYNMNCGNTVIANELRSRGEDVQARGNSFGMSLSQFGQFFSGFHSGSFCQTTVDVPDLSDKAWMCLSGLEKPTSESLAEISDRGDAVKRQLSAQLTSAYPVGSRGAMLVAADTSSHFISWERTSEGVIFTNPQNPERSMTTILAGYKQRRNNTMVNCAIRLDDLTVNRENIGEAVVDRLKAVKEETQVFNPHIEKGGNFVWRH